MSDNITTPVASGTVLASKQIAIGGVAVQVPENLIVDPSGNDAIGTADGNAGGNTLLGLLSAIKARLLGGGVGAMAAVPAASTNGTALGVFPAAGKGARLYLAATDSVTFTIASSAPGSAPAATFTVSGASGGTGPNWDEDLAAGQMIYVTAVTGAPKFRWY